MKNKTKLVLMATGLSCAVLGCLGSATYAWFTTKNDVGVNHTNLTVATTSPNLSVSMNLLNPTRAGTVNLSGIQEVSEGFTFTDLSSQYGETFYKKAKNANTYSVVSGDALQGHVLQYGLKVVNLPMLSAMDLYFNAAIRCGNNTESQILKNWVRTGIYECTDATYATKKSAGYEKAYMFSKSNENANKYVSGTGEEDISTYTTGTLQNYETPIAIASVKDAGTRFYKISIWMEGTANENQDSAAGGVVSIATSFSLVVAS